MKPTELKTFLVTAFENRWPVLITSGPGCGKTDIISDAVKTIGYDLLVTHPVVSDPTDFKGMPYVSPDGEALFVPFNDLKHLVDAKKDTVFFFDDFGQAPVSVQAAAMQLLLARRINDHIISDKVTFIAATNRRQDKAGVSSILEPVKSRFYSIVELTPSTKDWVEWAYKHDMPGELIGFIRWRESTKGGILYDFQPTIELQNSPCPRTVAFLGNMLKVGIPDSIKLEVFKGAVGAGFTSEFLAYLNICKELPDPADIINNPTKVPIPKKPDILFAICSNLVTKTTRKNFVNIMKFINRLPDEFGLMLVQDILTMDNTFADLEPFTEWSSAHLELLP
jgi:hypothetical protein